MNAKVQKLCGWSGLASAIMFFFGFWVIAGFMTPPSPQLNALQIAELFQAHRNQIRTGMIVSMVASTLLAPWVAAITVQMRRIEGRYSVLAITQLALGAILVLELVYLLMFWQVAAFRPERDASQILLLNDMAWIPFVGMVSTSVLQAIVIGIAILGDRRSRPVYPRWAGYFNVWSGLMFTPGCLNVFFRSGPLAWNGLLAWYLPLIAFGTWMIVMSWLTARAVNSQASEGEDEPSGLTAARRGNGTAGDVEALTAELAQMREELVRVSVGDAEVRKELTRLPARAG